MTDQPKTMLRKRYMLTCTLLFAGITTCYSQDEGPKWINENAHVLAADTAVSSTDLQFLTTELKNNIVFGLGEPSHGSREVFNQKRRVIEYLILHLHYKQIGFEFGESYISPINQYLINGTGDLKTLMKEMVLYNTEEIYHLFQFIKQNNDKQPPAEKISIFGFDRQAYAADPFTRDKFMAANVVTEQSSHKSKTIVWAHNVHIAKDTTMAQFRGMDITCNKNLAKSFMY